MKRPDEIIAGITKDLFKEWYEVMFRIRHPKRNRKFKDLLDKIDGRETEL